MLQKFKDEMRLALDTAECPLDASLEKVMPGMHQRLEILANGTKHLESKMDARMDVLQSKIDSVETTMAGVQTGVAIVENTSVTSVNRVDRLAYAIGTAICTSSFTFWDAYQSGNFHLTPQAEHSPLQSPPPRHDHDPGDALLPVQPRVMPNLPVNLPATMDSAASDHSGYRMTPNHSSLMNVWNEWFGLDKYEDDFGGIEGRNKKFGSKWRKHLQQSSYSRNCRLIKGISDYAKEQNCQPEEVIAEWEPLFVSCKSSVANMVRALQKAEKITKKASRGIHNKLRNSETNNNHSED